MSADREAAIREGGWRDQLGWHRTDVSAESMLAAMDDEAFDAIADERTIIRYRKGSYPAYRCAICASVITRAHFKRHLKKHDREGIDPKRVNSEWLRFVTEQQPCEGET